MCKKHFVIGKKETNYKQIKYFFNYVYYNFDFRDDCRNVRKCSKLKLLSERNTWNSKQHFNLEYYTMTILLTLSTYYDKNCLG